MYSLVHAFNLTFSCGLRIIAVLWYSANVFMIFSGSLLIC